MFEVFTPLTAPSVKMPHMVRLDVSSGVLEHCQSHALAERIVSERTMVVERVVLEDISLIEMMAVRVEASWDLTKPVPRPRNKIN